MQHWKSGGSHHRSLEKYDKSIELAGTSFDKGTAVWHNVAILTSCRNRLVHFQPEWHGDLEPAELESVLKQKIKKSGLLDARDGSSWVICSLAAPGAEWAVIPRERSLGRGATTSACPASTRRSQTAWIGTLQITRLTNRHRYRLCARAHVANQAGEVGQA